MSCNLAGRAFQAAGPAFYNNNDDEVNDENDNDDDDQCVIRTE